MLALLLVEVGVGQVLRMGTSDWVERLSTGTAGPFVQGRPL